MRYAFHTSIIGLLLALFFPAALLAKPWKGAEVITHETFKYGAFEARIRAAEGSGIITAFFLWKHGSEEQGAEWQEQDIEIFGKNGRFQTQIMTPGEPRTAHSVRHRLATDAWENYYTYRMEWTPDYLAFYVDDNLIRLETNMSEYGKLLDPERAEAAQLRINVWAGDWSWSGEFDESKSPGHTYVDYIQVFDYTPDQGEDQSDFSLRWRDDFNSLNTDRWWFANWTFDRAINDFVSSNAAARDGKLVLALTSDEQSGQFPSVIPPNNDPLPPVDAPVYSSIPEDIVPFDTPARIEAEYFQAYYDTTPGNSGHDECGTGDVDSQVTDDVDGHCNIAWTRRDEYLTYWIRIPDSEEYTFRFRVATPHEGMTFHVESDGDDISGPLTVEPIDWQTYQDIEFTVPMVDGIREISVVFDTGSINFNYFVIDNAENPTNPDPVDPPNPPEEPEEPETPDEPGSPEQPENGPVVLPARIQAENFTDYVDFTSGNEGSSSCGTGDVDMESTNDQQGNCNIGWTEAGEYTEYFVTSPQDQNYTVTLRLASDFADQYVMLAVDGSVLPVQFDAPNSGWQSFADVTADVHLEAGEHRIRVLYETGSTNFNFMTWEVSDASPPEEIPEEPPTEGECTSSTYEAEDMYHSTGGDYDGGWNIWTNGHISSDHTFDGSAATLTVIARGDFAGDDLPNMRVSIGEEVIGEVEIRSEDYVPYEFSFSPSPGSAEVKIEFTNDYVSGDQDRNLRVDAVVIEDCE